MPVLHMKMKTPAAMSFLVVLFCTSFFVRAQTRYVSDDFEVMMRTGPSIQNKIVRALKSGDRIEVLREDSGNGHSQVQAPGGEIGYVLTRFLSPNPAAKSRVQYLEGQLQQLRSKPGEVQSLFVKSQEDNQLLINQNLELTNKLKTVTNELETIKEVSKDAVSLAERNQRLESEVQQLLLQLDDIRIQNQALRDNADYVRNLTMAGILLLGLFLGWVLSRSGRQQRGSWGA